MPIRIDTQAEPIPGYKLLERVGGGGFGEVWKVEAPGGLMKAIKFVFGNLETIDAGGAPAEQELKALARVKSVRHPYILSLEQIIVKDGQLMIVMELADRNLWDRFKEAKAAELPGIPREELLDYMEEAAEALDLMNSKYDLQHLDIKPQNLFLVHNHIKVADFGLVKDLEGLAASVTGGVTPYYAAPETFEGWVSRFSDQYSLAIVYQEMLCGRRPFTASNTRQLIMKHLHAEPDLESIPAHDRPFIARALAKKPADRHATCLDLIKALRSAGQASLAAAPVETAPPPTVGSPPDRADSKSATPVHLVKQGTPKRELQPGDSGTPRSDSGIAASIRSGRTEKRGDGVLMPGLVIGLGRLGAEVLGGLRHKLQTEMAGLAELPHLRLLYIDTDADTINLAARENVLSLEESLLVRLNKHSHYLRPRDPLPPVEDWLTPQMVYRIPREMTTTGVRALGRLAFVDHYQTIAARLRREVERITPPDALNTAMKTTGLRLRSNWPRVYVVANLSGGTGSGMFLDLAYVVRAVLRDLGFLSQDIVGVFMLPEVQEGSAQAMATANGYAALLELNHFLVSGQAFQAQYDSKAPPLTDHLPPFSRCVFLALPAEADVNATSAVIESAANGLFLELFTPAGREADVLRREAREKLAPTTTTSLGLTILHSPRQELIRRAARHLGRTIAESWLRKLVQAPPAGVKGDAADNTVAALGEAIRAQLNHQFQQQKLETSMILEELQGIAVREMGRPAEQVFAGFLEPLKRTAQAGLDGAAIRAYLKEVDQLLGSSEEMSGSWRPPRVLIAVNEATDQVLNRAGDTLIGAIKGYLDKSGYRVGGAEEAVRQSAAILEGLLTPLEIQGEQLKAKLQSSGERIQMILEEADHGLASSKLSRAQRTTLSASLPELLLRHALLRYQQILTQALLKVYFSLRGRLTDQMRELNYCRQRFRELLQTFGESSDLAAPEAAHSHGMQILPRGCNSLAEAVEQTLQTVSTEDAKRLDELVQTVFQSHFPPLAQVCSTPGAEIIRRLHASMLKTIESELERRLPVEDVAQLFLAQNEADPAEAVRLLLDMAVPSITQPSTTLRSEVCIVAAPETDSGRRFVQLLVKAWGNAKPIFVKAIDSIIIYREAVNLKLAKLEQMSPPARQAYEMSRSRENFTPHARLDITEWKEPTSA